VVLEEASIAPPSAIVDQGQVPAVEPETPPQVATRSPSAAEVLPRVNESEPEEEERRGFFQRLNPVNLFRSEKPASTSAPSREMVTPLPPETGGAPAQAVSRREPTETREATARPAETVERPPARPTQVATATPTELKPVTTANAGLRYDYGRIKRPVAGDRAAAERLFKRGVGSQSRADPAGAATFFAAAAEADPTYFAAQYNHGLVAYSSGQWFKALSAFETARVLDPSTADARYNFALTLQKARFPVDAAQELETVVAQNPGDARNRLLLGNVYSQDLGEVAAARRQYQQVLGLEPRHPQATAIRYWLSQHP
jgi:tetratricopeptide (TPR) repeat protein